MPHAYSDAPTSLYHITDKSVWSANQSIHSCICHSNDAPHLATHAKLAVTLLFRILCHPPRRITFQCASAHKFYHVSWPFLCALLLTSRTQLSTSAIDRYMMLQTSVTFYTVFLLGTTCTFILHVAHLGSLLHLLGGEHAPIVYLLLYSACSRLLAQLHFTLTLDSYSAHISCQLSCHVSSHYFVLR